MPSNRSGCNVLKILFVGDIVGKVGRQVLSRKLGRLVDVHKVDFVVANGENAAAGFGLTLDVTRDLFDYGIDVITSGNHIWDKKEIYDYLDRQPRLLRPGNYPGHLPGKGVGLYSTPDGTSVAVLNLEGRVFMNNLDCPFRAADVLLEDVSTRAAVVLVDFHAETTSEKLAMGYYLDGRVSAVLGTHTHVQTADERVLAGGTAYITDAGMTGSRDAVIGFRKELAIERFLTQVPVRLEVAKNDPVLCGVLVTVDPTSGKALSIERVCEAAGTD